MSSQTSGRWKLLCGALAALTIYSWTRNAGVEPVSHASASRPRSTAYRPIRVSAAALGVSVDELVARLHASRSVSEIRTVAQQLGAVGDDAAIDDIRVLIADPRPGVADAIIEAIGAIGTDHAVDVLIEISKQHEYAAYVALGTTGHERAETYLIGRARRGNETAITALGALATDRAADVLYRIAASGGDETAEAAISTLGRMDTAASAKALAQLIDSPSVKTAERAIGAIETVNPQLLAKLTTIARSGEPALATAAVNAIAHAGTDGLPALRDIVTHGENIELRAVAVRALGTAGGADVVDTLGELLEDGEAVLAQEAARALALIATPEARDQLISAALSDRAEASDAVSALVTIDSPEVEVALIEIAKAGEYGAGKALERLLARDIPEALDLVVERAKSDNMQERLAAFDLLAGAGTDEAAAKLIALVRADHSEAKVAALELVVRTRPADPQTLLLLRESLLGGEIDEQRAAATALGKVGTDEAREALVRALGSPDVAHAALGALSAYRLDEATSSAIMSAASSNAELLPEAMRRLLSAGVADGLQLAQRALDGDETSAIRALQILGETSTPGAVELITRATRASSEDVRMTAIRSLGSQRDDKAVDAVAAALRDTSPGVRETAAGALNSIGGDRARDALLAMTRSAEASDRLTALQYLPDDPASGVRMKELLRDPDSRVSYYALRGLVASQQNAHLARALVFDASAPYETRYHAARLLEGYGRIDEATQAWLDEQRASGDYYY